MLELVKYVVVFVVPVVYLIYRRRSSSSSASSHTVTTALLPAEDNKRPLKSVMQAAREDLAPPKDDPFTTEQLKQYDGSDSAKPIYVAIKGGHIYLFCLFVFEPNELNCILGTVFDVSSKSDVYGAGKSYNIFAGKDGSKGLALSSLDPENAVADYRGLGVKEMGVLDDWHSFFSYV